MFSFPTLKLPEIESSLQNFFPELHITKNDIKNPVPSRLAVFYTKFLQKIHVNVDYLYQFPVQTLGIENFEYAEIFEDSLPLVAFSNTLTYTLSKIGYTGFHLGDIIHPDGSRTRRILSAITNFLLFFDEHHEAYMAVFAEAEAVREQVESARLRNEEAKKELKNLKMRQREKEKLVKEKKAAIQKSELDIQDMQKEKIELAKIYAACNEKHATLQEELGKKRELKENERVIIENLLQKIVKSPERLLEKIKMSAEELEQLKTIKVEKNKRMTELKLKIANYQSWYVETSHLIERLTVLNEGLKKESELSSTIPVVINKKEMLMTNLTAAESRREGLELQIQNRKEHAIKTQMQYKLKKTSILANLEALEKQKKNKVAADTEDELAAVALKEKLDDIIREEDEVKRDTLVFKEQHNKDYKEFRDRCDSYVKEVTRILLEDEARCQELLKK